MGSDGSADEVRSAARPIAERLLAVELPRRWRHVQGVAATAELIATEDPDCRPAVAAAWLHDVGYASPIASVGFHPLDGARYVRAEGFDDEIVGLVAFHSCAHVEAAERGLLDVLESEFEDLPSASRDALWAADATTGPDGARLTLENRLADIAARYGADHLVTRCSRAISAELAGAVTRSRARAPRAFEF